MHNLDVKTALRKAAKKFLASMNAKNAGEARSDLNALYKKLDKAAKRGILHKNTAARRKSKFSRQLASCGTSATPAS